MFVLIYREFQHTAARRRLQPFYKDRGFFMPVSTHSRAEAAATRPKVWLDAEVEFQHTAARRRLRITSDEDRVILDVSTHSRAEAAALTKPKPPLVQ